MNTISKRFAAAFLLSATVLSGSPAISIAATNPWSWNDISNQLTVRNNRPVWAMAYANGNWFYTDGLDLWNGGQVYRYDGATQANITLEVRNTGMNRVDDIVSDGQSILFLQNVATKSNNLMVVRYTNGTYTNPSSVIRSVFGPDETFSVITGKNGDWRFVSTKGRLFRWDGTTTPVQLTLPSDLQSRINDINANHFAADNYTFGNYVSYTNGMNWSTGKKLFVVPISGSRWLVTLTGPQWLAYHLEGTSFSSIQSSWNSTTDVNWVTSNGETAFILSRVGIANHNDPESVRLWNGNGTNALYNINSNGILFSVNGTSRAYSNGTDWMMLTDKQQYRITASSMTLEGTTRDYFLTAASNGFGTFLVGGVESNLSTNGPVFPLQAKLVKVTNDGGTTTTNPPTSNTQTSNGISAWSWVEPNQSFIRRDQHVTFGVGAWSDKGIKHLDIVVNGVNRNACHFANAMGNQQCTYSIWGGEFGLGTNVSVNAKITNGNDQVLWTELKNLNVTDANGTVTNPTPSNTNSNTNLWTWSEPETSQFKTNESAKFFVGAYDPEGIQKIEFYVNGSIWNTCSLGNAYGNQQCSVTINGSSFAAGSDVFVNAKVTDSQGNIAWSSSRSYRVNAADGSTPAPTTGNTQTSSWVWSDPEKSSLVSGDVSTFHVGAWDNDGLQRMDIWVNGVVKQTCNFGTAFGNRECSFAIYANDYKAGTNVFVNAAIVDSKGETTWSASRSYAITSSNTNGQVGDGSSNLPGSIQVTSNRDNGFYANDTITVSANAQDQNGLRRIDLFVNGTLYKTCNNTGSCSVTVGPFPTRTSISYGATVVDNAGYAIWTGYKTVYKK